MRFNTLLTFISSRNGLSNFHLYIRNGNGGSFSVTAHPRRVRLEHLVAIEATEPIQSHLKKNILMIAAIMITKSCNGIICYENGIHTVFSSCNIFYILFNRMVSLLSD